MSFRAMNMSICLKIGFLWLLINTKPPLLEVRKLMMKQWK